jgi:septal ring factor EnvC (AmiA/AmiB activator)
MMYFRAVTIFLCVLLVTTADSKVYAQAGMIRTEQELNELKDSIRELGVKLQNDRGRQQSITSQLEIIERDRASIDARFVTHSLELENLKVRKMALSARMFALGLERENAVKELSSLVLSSYVLSRQDGIQLVLNQVSPAKIATTLQMYSYIAEAQKHQLDYTREVQASYRETVNNVESQQAAINSLVQDLQANRRQLEILETERGKQLSLVKAQLSKGENQVRQFQVREAELKQLLASLARKRETEKLQKAAAEEVQTRSAISTSAATAVDSSVTGAVATTSRSFSASRGRLPMPVGGRILKRFGQKRPESGLAWDGIMLDVQEGQAVSAVFRGQVVFSDWFGSFGQLLVLDHGDGYMSLYGHNQLLHVSIGSMVDTGQRIASAGSTGGLARSALYFEIRHNGYPDDPLKWCKL